MSDMRPTLPFSRKLGYTVGNFGLNIYWQSISYYLLFFYTDVVGLSGAVAGSIYMAASIFDGLIDPVAGALMDRTRTRWGRYRPWIVVGAVPLALSFMLIYYSPNLEGTLLVLAVIGGHLLFRVCYTCVAVPYSSLTARISSDQGERTQITAMSVLFASAAGAAVAFCTQPLVAMAGGAQSNGFFWAATFAGTIATVIFFVVVLVTKEPQDALDTGESEHAKVDLAAIKTVMKNKAFLFLAAGLLFSTLNTTIVSKSLLYYFKYVVGDKSSSRLALTFATTAAFVLIPIWAYVAKRTAKRTLWLTAITLGIVGVTFLGITRPTDPITATAAFVILQTAIVGIAVAYWAMLPDTVEYGEWASGVRLKSFLFGLFMFFQKLGLGLAAGLFGYSLSLVGYDPQAPNGGGLATALPYMIVLLCGVSLIGSGIAVFFSPLRKGVHEKITQELEQRRQANLV